MNRLYKAAIGIFIVGLVTILGTILIIHFYPDHRIEILAAALFAAPLALIAALWLAFTTGDLKVSKELQMIKKIFNECYMKINLKICFIRGKYSKYERILIKNAFKKVLSGDENERKIGLEQLSQFKGKDIYVNMVELLEAEGGAYMEIKRILWMDADADLLKGLVKPLKKDGYRIIVAKNEKEALEAIKKSDFDLILSEITIPTGMEGSAKDPPFIGMRLLKTFLIDMKIETPIMVLSVVSDEKMIDDMRDMGVKKVLQKGAVLPIKLRKEVYEVLEVRD